MFHCFQKNDQLCWTCLHAVPSGDGQHGCSWSKKLEPVPDWVATPTRRVECGIVVHSYRIHACPQYRQEPRRSRKRAESSHQKELSSRKKMRPSEPKEKASTRS